MILCVYHGSSFKAVNETQTANITKAVTEYFSDQQVIECYYSTHVLAIMERRETPLLAFKQALIDNYDSHEQIYILLTNMMNGSEYQAILKTIAEVDSDHKVKVTKYLLDKSNVYDIAEAVVDPDNPTLYIGHGSLNNNRDYQMLNDILVEDNNYVSTLHSDLKTATANFYSKNIIVKPLMITSAYHAKRDIEVTLKEQLIELGYNPIIDLQPLALNSKLVSSLVNNLIELIDEQDDLN